MLPLPLYRRPMIHILFAELKEVLFQLLLRFVKPEEVNNITGANLQKLNLDTVDILLPLEKCYVGPRTEEALKLCQSMMQR